MTARWFRKHRVGYGWSPATWQGWAVAALFAAACFAMGSPLMPFDPQTRLAAGAALTIAVIVLVAFTSGKDSDA